LTCVFCWRPAAEQFYRNVLEFRPEEPPAQNQLAWLLANCPVPEFRDPTRALELAKKAHGHLPNDGYIWNTLGVAHYRMGNWKDAIAALEKSMQLRKSGDSYDWFFLALAHWQLGDKEQAHKWYAQAVKGMDRPRNEGDRQEFRRFHEEAAQLLGIQEQPTKKEKEKPQAKAPSR
jgi:tetratricopeptide (TPR) repeat protein